MYFTLRWGRCAVVVFTAAFPPEQDESQLHEVTMEIKGCFLDLCYWLFTSTVSRIVPSMFKKILLKASPCVCSTTRCGLKLVSVCTELMFVRSVVGRMQLFVLELVHSEYWWGPSSEREPGRLLHSWIWSLYVNLLRRPKGNCKKANSESRPKSFPIYICSN